jgi:hypothetical protein
MRRIISIFGYEIIHCLPIHTVTSNIVGFSILTLKLIIVETLRYRKCKNNVDIVNKTFMD